MFQKPFSFNDHTAKFGLLTKLTFHKSYFDIENISNTASDLKYTDEIKALINLNSTSPVFVKHFANQVYPGKLTEKILTQFTELVKRSSNQVLNDAITNRLKTALGKDRLNSNQTGGKVTAEPVMAESNVVTTDEEIEGFFIVKSILRETIDHKRITYRDAQSYFAILLDDNNRKTICRLYLGNKKYLVVLDDNKKEVKHEIMEVNDIYNHSELLKTAIDKLEIVK